MSDQPIIEVENLGKRYRLGAGRGAGQNDARYRTLRESLSEGARLLLPRGGRTAAGSGRAATAHTDLTEFWALKDVSFSVAPGEVVGIIGRNGAGKSTLLKILSRITEPTEGRVTLRGRVASLLEVGTGFHPELTGRENIFLNGAVLGMQRAEIRRKFDEIVAFAEVERFLDTPVKRYSSGMYVRLAFAVAAHLEPEILIVDEVLAVGDAEFQKKCLGKMDQVAKGEGRTVLFVSHNMGAIQQLCSRALMLSKGKVIDAGGVGRVTGRYFTLDDNQKAERTWSDLSRAPGNEAVRLVSARLINKTGDVLGAYTDVRSTLGVEICYQVLQDGTVITPSLHLHNSEGAQVFLAIDLEEDWMLTPRGLGLYSSTAWIPGNFLNTGMHYIGIALSRLDAHVLYLFEQQILAFHTIEGDGFDTARGVYANPLPGVIRPILNWRTKALNSVEVRPVSDTSPIRS